MTDTISGTIDDVMKPSSDKELEAVRNFLKSHQFDCDFTIEIREPYTEEQAFRVEFVDNDGKSHILSEHPIIKKKSKWHRIEDKLPELDKVVLITLQSRKTMFTAYRTETHWTCWPMGEKVTGTIMEWRKLHKLPKREK